MALVLVAGPALEPVSLTEAKNHLRVDQDDEDILIGSLVTAARIHLETRLGRAFINQQWEWWLDAWSMRPALSLPISPVHTLHEVVIYSDKAGAEQLAPEIYDFDGLSDPPRLIWRHRPPGPARLNGLKLGFTAGYGAAAADVPAPLRQAILLLAAHWYENREPAGADRHKGDLPPDIALLLSPYKGVRL